MAVHYTTQVTSIKNKVILETKDRVSVENIKDLIAECSEALFSFEVVDNDQLKVGFDSEQPDP
ncbi:hypothetical protein, partial [Pseudoalteromonas sp. MMG005]|uniref:hypothetical protein n=1 Tax=Pseudoalteromonas sp. MMG005 TaxID=2822682 RepID=UPI001B3A756F